MHTRIILVGPTCSGKTFLRYKFSKKGYVSDISYTTRRPRKGEIKNVDYHYISNKKFMQMIEDSKFYEHVKYDNIRYGTGIKEWNESDVFIMETNGVSILTEEDRKYSFVIYLNPERMIRENRMRYERGWSQNKVIQRTKEDFKRFNGFKDYDMIITNAEF